MIYERIRYTCVFDNNPDFPGEMQTKISSKKVFGGNELNTVQEGIPESIPPEGCYFGGQESLVQLVQLVEAEIPG